MSNRTLALSVTQVSMNQTALDWPRNMSNIYAAIREAHAQGADMVTLEELAMTGYDVGDDFQRVGNGRVLEALDDIAAYANSLDPNLIISIGHPWRVQMRDIPAEKGMEGDLVKNPFYDRMNKPFNVQTAIMGGKILGITAKSNLYNDGRGYEDRYFNATNMAAVNAMGGVYGTMEIPLNDDGTRQTFFGRPIFYFHDGNGKGFYLAFVICEEKWVLTKFDGHPYNDSRYTQGNIIPTIAEHLGSKEGLVISVSNASPPARDKVDSHVHLNKMVSEHCEAMFDTDGLGTSGATFSQFGIRMGVQDGKLVSYGRRMAFSNIAADTTTIQVTPVAEQGKAHASIQRAFKNAAAPAKGSLAYEVDPAQAWDDPKNPNRHYEEVIRYTAFWLFDYMRKGNHKGIMEALSGGADSGFNSAIVAVMVNMGVKELGIEKFCDELKLPYKKEVMAAFAEGGEEAAIERCMQKFLTGLYMGTNNSAESSAYGAEFLIKGGIDKETGEECKGIGGKFVSRNVQDLLDFYAVLYAVEDLESMPHAEREEMAHDIVAYLNMDPDPKFDEQREATAEALYQKYPMISDLVTAADGAAYENIQARGRQVLVMLFSNKERKMAVANPNLDEARNAYSTFGGDLHSGTINMNGHLPKEYELGVMRYLYEHGVQGVMPPIRALGPILRKKPSAELLPKDAEGNVVQDDETALQRTFAQMDLISSHMLYTKKKEQHGERRLTMAEVYDACQANELFKGITDYDLYNKVRLSYNQWNISQHKIHAAPICPTFGSNVDHQTSQRTPNLSGESRDELVELGLRMMHGWAKRDGIVWSDDDMAVMNKRAWQDPKFVRTFESAIWSGEVGRSYDLRKLYGHIVKDGWGIFPPLNDNHEMKFLYQERLKLSA